MARNKDTDLVAKLLEYLREPRVSGQDSGYYTARELSSVLGVDIFIIRRALRSLKSRGDLLIGKKGIEDLSGRYTHVAAYKVAEKAVRESTGT